MAAATLWLTRMSAADKIGQMTQLDISMVLADGCPLRIDDAKLRRQLRVHRLGSLLNSPFSGTDPRCGSSGWNASEWRATVEHVQAAAADEGLPPLIYGIDSVHGASYCRGATLLPQQLGLAASFDESLAAASGWLTGKDSRAAATPWMFAPILGVATHPLWPRVYETFGEDPLLVARMGAAVVEGMQRRGGEGEIPARAAACMKHFVGYSAPRNGHDREGAWLSRRELEQTYLPPFQAAVDAGVQSAMESYQEVNGEPVVGSAALLQGLLRERLGFEGLLVTDWHEVGNLHDFHRVARSPEEAVLLAIGGSSSLDMSMGRTDESFSLPRQLTRSHCDGNDRRCPPTSPSPC